MKCIFRPWRILFLLGALAAPRLAAAAETNTPLSSLRRLERTHLEATHRARNEFARERRPVRSNGLYEDFSAILHVHAEDAEHTKGTRVQLLAAARATGIRVVMTTDHRGPKAEAWRGMHEGVLFIAGSETGDGTLWFPDYSADGKPFAGSGLRFLCHIEERYDAVTDGMVGMEICNRHSDAILDKGPELYLATAMLNSNRWNEVVADYQAYPDEFFAAGSDHHPPVFAKWDRETKSKHFTGIAANDAHQNVILKGVTFDRYEVSFRDLTTHILARELTEPQIREALEQGHVYVAHDWLCDPSGFQFGAINNLGVFTMGDDAPLLGRTRLVAATPLPAKLRLIREGAVIRETTGTNLTVEAKEPGAYRLEAWLTVDGEDRPWIYANPVYLKSPSLADLRLPSLMLSPGVEARKDITYCDGPETEAAKHKLDLYIPSGKSGGKSTARVLFFIHGGAWRSGDRTQYLPLGNRFAQAGLLTVIPSYRLAPKFPHPAQIEDVAAAFAWTIRHIGEYGGDTNEIFVAGHSAGGHLAALLSLDEQYLAKYQLSAKLIRGVIGLSGVYDLATGEGQESVFGRDRQVRRKASPLYQIHAGAPPFLVTYCQWDYFSLPGQARQFSRALESAGDKSTLLYIPRESHISEMLTLSSPTNALMDAALQFVNQHGAPD